MHPEVLPAFSLTGLMKCEFHEMSIYTNLNFKT